MQNTHSILIIFGLALVAMRQYKSAKYVHTLFYTLWFNSSCKELVYQCKIHTLFFTLWFSTNCSRLYTSAKYSLYLYFLVQNKLQLDSIQVQNTHSIFILVALAECKIITLFTYSLVQHKLQGILYKCKIHTLF